MPTDQLSRTFGALADPTRRAILARLASGEATVGQLAEPFEMTFAAVSKHLRVLQDAGLVTRGRDAQYRPARLDARPLAQASGWIIDFAQFWGDSLDSLGAYLAELQRGDRDGRDRDGRGHRGGDDGGRGSDMAARPSAARPSAARPGAAQPSAARPSADISPTDPTAPADTAPADTAPIDRTSTAPADTDPTDTDPTDTDPRDADQGADS